MKQVKEERLAIVLELTRGGGTAPVQVSGRADYEVSSEDLTVTRSINIELTDTQKTTIKNFGANVVQQIKAIELG